MLTHPLKEERSFYFFSFRIKTGLVLFDSRDIDHYRMSQCHLVS